MGKAVNHYFSKSKHLTLKPKNLRDELFNIENGRIFVHYFFFLKIVTLELGKMPILKFLVTKGRTLTMMLLDSGCYFICCEVVHGCFLCPQQAQTQM